MHPCHPLCHLSLWYQRLSPLCPYLFTTPPPYTTTLPTSMSSSFSIPSLLFDTLRVAGELPSVFHLPLSHLSHSLPADPPTQRVLRHAARGCQCAPPQFTSRGSVRLSRTKQWRGLCGWRRTWHKPLCQVPLGDTDIRFY